MRPRGRASKTNRGTTLAPDAALPKPGLSSGAPDTHLEALPLLPLPSGLLAEKAEPTPLDAAIGPAGCTVSALTPLGMV